MDLPLPAIRRVHNLHFQYLLRHEPFPFQLYVEMDSKNEKN